jgi:hypothetical protein
MLQHLVGRSGIVLLGLAVTLGLGSGCAEGPPQILITSPVNGTFSAAASVEVAGILLIRVNGVSVLPLGPHQIFSTTLTLAAGEIVHPIVAEVIGRSGTVLRDRVTVIAGESIADGDLSPDAVALRIDEKGLEDLEPLVTSGVSLDLATLVPPGTFVDSGGVLLVSYTATIDGSPPPSISGFEVSTDPMQGRVAGHITLFDLFVLVHIDGSVLGVPFTCHITLSAATVLVEGEYLLGPLLADPGRIDVSQDGDVTATLGTFSESTNCGSIPGVSDALEAIVNRVKGNTQDTLRTEIENSLNQVDADGNTPIAAAVEDPLGGVAIAGPVGQAIGVDLEALFFAIDEDPDGITLGSNAGATASLPDPGAVDLPASFHVAPLFPPSFGPLAPNGQPYDLAMAISASALNQLLKAEVESGLLITSVSKIGPFVITPGLLTTLLPDQLWGFGVLDPLEPLEFQLYPTIAPIVTAEIGPAGEFATIRMAHLLLTLVPVADPATTLLEVAVDAETGLNVDFIGGQLSFELRWPAVEDINVTVLENPFYVDGTGLELLYRILIGGEEPVVGDSLGTFALPEFPGLGLDLVGAVNRDGEYLSLFFNLEPAP